MATSKSDTHDACMETLDRFMAALNEYDAGKMDAAMHFPHLRLANDQFKIYDAPGSNPMDLFTRLRVEDDWAYSRWEKRELIQFNDRKAHYDLSYTRYRGDDSVIGLYESLYILTFQDGRWGIQVRSSFGPAQGCDQNLTRLRPFQRTFDCSLRAFVR